MSNKVGLVPFARRLSELGVRLAASGGTANKIREDGVPVMCDLIGQFVAGCSFIRC